MKTALILGISGGFGSHVAQSLLCQGWSIRALLRDPDKLPQQFQGIEIVQGDAADIDAVREAARDTEILVYGVNPANYRWDGVALPLMETSATVAEEQELTLVFPGNVYGFNPNDGPEFNEDSPFAPITSKGRIRTAMEQRLQLATDRGARVIIVRMGDFIGAHAPSTWLNHLVKCNKNGYNLAAAGPHDLPHSWAYLPDAARTVVELITMKETLPSFSVFHFRGYRASFNDLANAIQQASGKPVKVCTFPWILLRLLAPFNITFRGLVEMRYLWKQEINLSDDKLQQTLGNTITPTPLPQALLQSGLLTEVKTAELNLKQVV